MIRWSYVLPRVLLLGAVLAFVAFGLDPLIHWVLIRSGEQLLGARVEVGSVRTSLSGVQLKLSGVKAANPHSPLENLFEADAVMLDLDAEALLLRRLIVERGHIAGLRLNTLRDTSGALAPGAVSDSGGGLDLSQFDEKWLAAVSGAALENLTEDFESIQLIESASDRWQTKFTDWKNRIDALQQRAKDIKKKYKEIDRRDPRQIAQALQQAPQDVGELRREFDNLRREIENTQSTASQDFQEISAARDRDLQRWRDRIGVDEFNAAKFTSYLLGPTIEQRMGEVMTWVQHAQAIAAESGPPQRQTLDEEIRFGQVVEPPDYLVRELIVDGFVEINGRENPFGAIATDIAYPPSKHGKPTRVQLMTKGDVAARVEGLLDYRTSRPLQQFVIQCPRLASPETTLGQAGKLGVRTKAGHARLDCRLTLQDGKIRGRIDLRQNDVALEADVAEAYGSRVRESLQASLSQVKDLTATVKFQGNPRRPEVDIESDLGEHVVQAIRGAMGAELDHQQKRLEKDLNGKLNKRLDSLDAMLAKKKEGLLGELNLNSQQLDQILQLAPQLNLGRLNMPSELNLNGILRR